MKEKDVEKVIAALEAKELEHSKKAHEIRGSITTIRSVFGLDVIEESRPSEKPIPRRTTSQSKQDKLKKPTQKTKRRGGGKYSQHKGVSRNLQGGKPWKASAWKNGKLHYCGTHDTEIEAAIAVQEYLGDTTEVKRLRKLAKHEKARDAGPQMADKSKGARGPEKGGGFIYKCANVRCQLEWKTKPVSCPGCNGTSFKKIPAGPESDHQSHRVPSTL